MFKSQYTTHFQNDLLTSSSYPSFISSLYDTKPQFQARSKKTGVKFQMETDKENTSKKQATFQNSSHKSIDRFTKTWTGQRYVTEADDENSKSALKELMSGFNYKKDSDQNGKSANLGSSTKLYHTDNFGFSSKKFIHTESRKFIEEPLKPQRSFKQCKSMTIIPSFQQDEDTEISSFKPKKVERKYKKIEAYNDLLKQSQNLIQKYKKLQVQKSQLRIDLKTQIEFNSKSSKKITFLEETQTHKYDKVDKQPEKSDKPSISLHQSKSYKSKDLSLSKKYGNYDHYESPSYQFKYELKPPKQLNSYSSSKNLNKTFSSTTKLMYSGEDSSYLKADTFPSTASGGFGLSRSASSKKISMSGLSLNDFDLGKCLGSGAFGQVFPAKHKKTGFIFALKKVPKEKVKYMLDQFITEIKIQLFLDHPNVVKLYSFFDDDLHFYILMEYMQGGSLYAYLKKQKTLTLEQTSTKLRQVCEGLQHMHENQILHRDIKPQNIVMSHNVAKLCDFGWSAICKDRRTTYCGTLDYVSPQIIGGDGYYDSVDIWCVGVLTYELIVGKTPFFNISRKETMKKIMDCNLQYPSTMPEIAVRFVKNILKKNPDQRQSIAQILKHPLLQVSQTTNNSLF